MTITENSKWTPEPREMPWLSAASERDTTDATDVADGASAERRIPRAGTLTPPRTLTHIPAPAAEPVSPPPPAAGPDTTTPPTTDVDVWLARAETTHAGDPPPSQDIETSPAVQARAPLAEVAVSEVLRGPSSSMQPVPLDLPGLVRIQRTRPTTGWRAALFAATSGRWNPGLSRAECERCRLIERSRTHLPGHHNITVTSLKGGTGKTTAAAGLGLTLAEHRGDRIVALDANPDAGTLADRLTGHCGITLRELIDNIDTVKSWTDMAHYTSLAGRLQVLASEQDPAMSEAFSREEYQAVSAVLARFYNVIITDSGTGLVHSAMGGALDTTNTLVIAGAPTLDGASRAAKTLDWLVAHGYHELVDRAVVALSCDRTSRDVDRAAIVAYFQARCHTVVEIPADPHLAIGGVIELAALREPTRDAFLRLSAAVAEQFSWSSPQTGWAA